MCIRDSYKITDRKQVNQGLLVYTLHFASREFMRNLRTRVNGAYDDKIDTIVAQIFADKTGIDSRKNLTLEETRNSDKIVVPNMRPLNAINMLAKKALAGKSKKGAGYYFYETTKGLYFQSWENMCAHYGTREKDPIQQFF